MFEKLLSLLLQAKSGAVATVFVLGASGALVTATVTDGVATITVTPNESSTTGSTTTGSNTTTPNGVEQAILALFNRTSAEDDPTSTATGKGCSDEAHERNEQMKRVNDASKSHREEVKDLSRDAGKDAKDLVRDADTEIKEIRQLAVKAIHATFDCDPNEDADNGEDEDDTDDEDNTSTTSTTTSTTTTTVTADFTGDAEAIADLAIELMDEVVADLEEALEGLEDSDEATATNTKQNGKSDSDKSNKGKGNSGKGKGRSR